MRSYLYLGVLVAQTLCRNLAVSELFCVLRRLLVQSPDVLQESQQLTDAGAGLHGSPRRPEESSLLTRHAAALQGGHAPVSTTTN